MKPTTRNLRTYKGATFTEVYRLWTDTEKTVPFNLALYSVRMKVCSTEDGTGTVVWNSASAPAGSSITVSNAAAGEITLTFNATVTQALANGSFFYDIELFLTASPEVTVYRLFQGKFFNPNDNVTVP